MAVDVWANNVSCLLHMDGNDGGTTFTEEKGKTVTVGGAVTTETSTYKFGIASGDFPGGNSDRLSLAAHDDFNLGTCNLTIEGWFKENNISKQYMTMLEKDSGAFPAGSWTLYINYTGASTGDIAFAAKDYDGTGTPFLISTGTDYGDNVWHHVAVTRNGNWWHLWVDGVLVDVALWTGSITDLSTAVYVGNSVNASRGWEGQLDEWRVTKGVARYTTGFTVPAGAGSNTPDDGTSTGNQGPQGAPGLSLLGPPGEDGVGLAAGVALPPPPPVYSPADIAQVRRLIEAAFRG